MDTDALPLCRGTINDNQGAELMPCLLSFFSSRAGAPSSLRRRRGLKFSLSISLPNIFADFLEIDLPVVFPTALFSVCLEVIVAL